MTVDVGFAFVLGLAVAFLVRALFDYLGDDGEEWEPTGCIDLNGSLWEPEQFANVMEAIADHRAVRFDAVIYFEDGTACEIGQWREGHGPSAEEV